MKTLLMALLLAASAAPAMAADTIVGTWCLTESVVNGYDTAIGKMIPRTRVYRRGSDCPKEDRLIIGRKGIPGYDAQLSDDGKTLIVDKDMED
jgi:hypothetical protein